MNLDLDNLGDNDLDVNLDVNLDLDLEGHPFRDSKKLRYTKTTYYYTSNTKYTFTSSPIRTLLQSESIILQNKENIVSTCKHNYIYEVVTNSPVSIHKFKDDIIISSNNFTINKLYYIYSTEAQQEFSLDITPKYLEKYITLAVENQEETYVNFIKKYLILLTDTNLKNIASMNQNLLNKILDQFLVDNSYDVYTIFKAN